MSTHENSQKAHHVGRETGEFGGRAAACLAAVRALGTATDRQVRDFILSPMADMNSVRPRLTELVQAYQLIECGSVKDELTGKMVRLVRCTTVEEQGERAASLQMAAAQLALEWQGQRETAL